MSLLPIGLPLYPIMNASETVQRLLAEDAEKAKSWPSQAKDDTDRARDDSAVVDRARPSNQITAVEASAETVVATSPRAGAEDFVRAGPVVAPQVEDIEDLYFAAATERSAEPKSRATDNASDRLDKRS